MTVHKVVIIGSGPAGYTAGIYTGRASLEPVLVASSVEPGGELTKTTDVENFPGFPKGIMGPDLMEEMREQAEKFGTKVVYDDVTALDLDGDIKRVTLGDGTVLEAQSVIFATGSAYRKLGLPDEDRLAGHGVSWCATCDGFFFREQVIAVVGGGDSAMEEATFLTKFADRVILIHRSQQLRASQVMIDRAKADPKIEFLLDHEVVGIHGEHSLESLTVRNTVTGAESALPVTGLFIAIGADPRTHLVHGQLELTEAGTIAVDGRSSRTSVPGVFAAGDVVDPTYKQAVTAAASGTVAAIDVEHYLAGLPATAAAAATAA